MGIAGTFRHRKALINGNTIFSNCSTMLHEIAVERLGKGMYLRPELR